MLKGLDPLLGPTSSPSCESWDMGDPTAMPEICREFSALVATATGRPIPLAAIERFAFYERARAAFAIVATDETRLYGNILLRKGVIRPG
jgi:L-fucose mutarotase